VKALSRQRARLILGALGLLALLALLLPSLLNVEPYRARLRLALERKLMRKVDFGRLSLHLLPRPSLDIADVVIEEDPNFGVEPFARADRISCDLRWRSLWHSRLDIAQLYLENPTLNLVRKPHGEWNVGSFLKTANPASPPSPAGEDLDLVADGGRLNFKVGNVKKPLAVTDLAARLTFRRQEGRIRFRLTGNPVRADLALATPGTVEVAGDWMPGPDLQGPLDATLRTRGSLLYDWIPLLTGRNPGIYGELDSVLRLTGSVSQLRLEGQGRLSQLHRWESLPPAAELPVELYVRGNLDRRRGRASLEALDASFGGSRLHLSGTLQSLATAPEADVVLAVERARLEDLEALARRLFGRPGPVVSSGRVDGLVAVQGVWPALRYGGFLTGQQVAFSAAGRAWRVPEVDLKLDHQQVRVLPVRMVLGPHLELGAEGKLQLPPLPHPARRGKKGNPPLYDFEISLRNAPLHDLLALARELGSPAAAHLDAEGFGTAAVRLTGQAWPRTQAALLAGLTGEGELRRARLLLPGLNQPVELRRAHLEIQGDRVMVRPLAGVVGSTSFVAVLQHQGERRAPWNFDLRVERLSVEEGAAWFEALGHPSPPSLLERIPFLRSLAARRSARSSLFAALDAQGHFSAAVVSYRSVVLRDFRARADISDRKVRFLDASFRAGSGHGAGGLEVNLADLPAAVAVDVRLDSMKIQGLTAYLPSALRGMHGTCSARAHLVGRGLSRPELAASLMGRGTLSLRNVSLGGFDPVLAVARANAWNDIAPSRAECTLHSASIDFSVRGGTITFQSDPLEIRGARFELRGIADEHGTINIDVRADLHPLVRRRAKGSAGADSNVSSLRLAGPLRSLRLLEVLESHDAKLETRRTQ
jgi:hypothetical protein